MTEESIYPSMPARQEVIDLLYRREDHFDRVLDEPPDPIIPADSRKAKYFEIKQILSMIDSSKSIEDIILLLQRRQRLHVTRDEDGKASTFFEATPEYTEVSYILGRITSHKTGVRRIDDE